MVKKVKAWKFYVETAEGTVVLENLKQKDVYKKEECLKKLGELVTEIKIEKMEETI